MSRGVAVRAVRVSATLALAAAFAAPVASAATADIIAPQGDPPSAGSGWQAGTCTTDTPTCTIDTEDQFFELAGAHPPVGFTQFIVKYEPGLVGPEHPIGELKNIRVDLPAGLSVNPQATPQCTTPDDPGSCPANTQVGVAGVTTSLLGVPAPPVAGLTEVPVYNLVPEEGKPALFGLNLLDNNVYLKAELDWAGDFHEGFTIAVPEAPKLEPLIEGLILKNRLVFDGRSGDGTFITTPTTCFDPDSPGNEDVYTTYLLASSIEEEEEGGYVFPQSANPPVESLLPDGKMPIDCGNIPYDPSIGIEPGMATTDSPTGLVAAVQVPFIEGGENRASSQTRRAQVTLPLGMGLNPSAANGLQTCTDAQFGKGTTNPVACPPASKVGVASINTPPLPDGSLTGTVWVGQQLSRDPTSGEQYRIFVQVGSERYGVTARLLGKVSANPQTGQLTTTFDDQELGGLPQVPFESFRLDFDDGPTAVLTSPPTCGPNTTTTAMTPWSGNAAATPSSQFSLSGAPGGGACAKTMAERPFSPSFDAGTNKAVGGTYSPLRMDIARADGNQELKGLDLKLPPGLTAKLAGVSYCPPAALAAAAASSGAEQAASSSCPPASLVGRAKVSAGSGPSPISIDGKAFLAGRFQGAPLSLAVVTPATAGPFDLGTVVVRVPLFVDPRTAQVRASTNAIPHVYGGALLDIRSVSVVLDRPRFSLNPTSCEPLAFQGALLGGGANPLDPASYGSAPVSVPFRARDCEKLGFRPKLFLRLFGATRRAKNPKFRAVLQAREGDANIGRAAVTLPRSLILDQANLQKVCTRVQYAAGDCPKSSIYGYARAFTPLLGKPVEGPVYLRSSDNPLPDLVASLRGQIDVELVGRTDSVRGRIRNTFDVVPDVPVEKFVLTLRGGKRGLLVNSSSQCQKASKAKKGKKRRAQRVLVRFKAHNGKKRNMKPKLRVPCKKKKRAGK